MVLGSNSLGLTTKGGRGRDCTPSGIQQTGIELSAKDGEVGGGFGPSVGRRAKLGTFQDGGAKLLVNCLKGGHDKPRGSQPPLLVPLAYNILIFNKHKTVLLFPAW